MLSGMFSECLLSICTLKELNNVNAGRLLLAELKGKEMHAPQRNRLDHRLWEQWIWKGKSYQCLQKPERRVQRRQARLFSVLFSGRTKSNTHRRTDAQTQEVSSEHQETIFAVGLTKCWSRLPREVAKSLSMKVFKSCLDTILRNMLWGTLHWEDGSDGLERSIPNSTILWFCEFCIKLHSLLKWSVLEPHVSST